MNPDEEKNPFKSLKLVQKIALLLLVITIITFYVLSIQYIMQ
ncbi:hypothetical protein SAMN05444338_12114 [Flavobacterium degerlachei]|jgi:hypothetical protein|uniref:Uncharacterized protein n=1 Tax=Flavobacterium degerlachei TaxID=229203 RepID=A0A1H3GA21_9FLAO|nr:hypothetical protein SAMN05444338_12114 [Flavobacterium degerlachei]